MKSEDSLGLLGRKIDRACAQPLLQRLAVAHQDIVLALGRLVAGRCLLLALADAALDRFEIFELQLGIDDALVAHGVDRAVDVGYVVVLEAAQHVDYRIGVADVGQELVAQTLALGGSLDKTGYVDDLDSGGYDAFRIIYFGQLDQTLVRHGYHAYVGFDSTEREVGRLRLGIRQTVEKRRLAYIGQSDYSAL